MTTKKTNLWMEHVKAFKQSHPDMTYKLILQEARKTYTKLKQPIESIVKSKTKAKKTPGSAAISKSLFKFLEKSCKQLFEENGITGIKSFVIWTRLNNNVNSPEFAKIKQCVDEYFALKNKLALKNKPNHQKRKKPAKLPFQISASEKDWMANLPDLPKKQKGPSRKAPTRPETFDPTLKGQIVTPTVALIQDMPRKRTTKIDIPVNKSEIRKLCKQLKADKKTQKSGTKKTNSWMDHIKQVRVDNPGMSYKEAMQKAKTTYNK